MLAPDSAARADSPEFCLACRRCGERHDLGPLMFGCPRCAASGTLSVVEVAYRRRPEAAAARAWSARAGRDAYATLVPGGDPRYRVSLGEGATPLLASRVIGPRLGLERLLFKNETANPTWSFKDRYVAVTVSVARQLGFERAIVSSTGNLGVSAAAYCAAAGIACVFLAPPETPRPFVDEARLHGARVLAATGEERLQAFERLSRGLAWFPIGLFLPRRVHNPFGVEGYKAIAYEIVGALGTAPVAVLFPCARGNGLFGAWKGFRDAVEWGWSTATPALVACQPVGANSLEASLRRGASEPIELPAADSVAASTRETVADGRALEALRESRGDAFSATDAEILQAVEDLGREGLCVEPASALPVACLPRLLAARPIPAGAPVVCVLTASGLRWPGHLTRGGDPPPPLDLESAVEDLLADRGVGRDDR